MTWQQKTLVKEKCSRPSNDRTLLTAKEQKKQLEQAILAYKQGYSAIEALLQWETDDRYKTKEDAVWYYGFGYNVERRLFAL